MVDCAVTESASATAGDDTAGALPCAAVSDSISVQDTCERADDSQHCMKEHTR